MLTSLTLFVLVYGSLLVAFLTLVYRAVVRGPVERPLRASPSGTVRRAFVHDHEEEALV